MLPGVKAEQAGSYSVNITNVAGATNSSAAVLTIYATAAPTLSGPAHLAGGQFQFSLSGVPGYSYVVSGSTNLSNWTPLQTNVSPFTFSDTNADLFPGRFYRARYLP